MALRTVSITGDVSDQQLIRYYNNKKEIKGFLELGGNFGGGTISFKISVSDGDVKNNWNDCNGDLLTFTAADTIEFSLPLVNHNGAAVVIYYTMSGSTTPSATLTIADNSG